MFLWSFHSARTYQVRLKSQPQKSANALSPLSPSRPSLLKRRRQQQYPCTQRHQQCQQGPSAQPQPAPRPASLLAPSLAKSARPRSVAAAASATATAVEASQGGKGGQPRRVPHHPAATLGTRVQLTSIHPGVAITSEGALSNHQAANGHLSGNQTLFGTCGGNVPPSCSFCFCLLGLFYLD